MIKLLLPVLICFSPSSGRYTPYKQEAVEGTVAHLDCNRTEHVEEPVDWRYKKTSTARPDLICSAGRVEPRHAARFQVDAEYTLTVHNVTVSDSGLYSCIEDSGGSSVIHDTYLQVNPQSVPADVTVHDFTRTGIVIAVAVIVVIVVIVVILFWKLKGFKGSKNCHIHKNLVKALRNYIDPEFGLLDHLLESKVINHDKFLHIKAQPTYYDKNDELLSWMSSGTDQNYDKFLECLRNTGQEHIVNFIKNSSLTGMLAYNRGPKEEIILLRDVHGMQWPLNDTIHQYLDDHRTVLKDAIGVIAVTGEGFQNLIDNLYQSNCITEKHKGCLEAHKNYLSEGSDHLLDILRRRSVADMMKFCQDSEAEVLKELKKLLQEQYKLETLEEISSSNVD